MLCSEIKAKINTSFLKGGGKAEIETMFFKSDIYDSF